MDINSLTEEEFNSLPLVVEGESKIVRYCGNGQVVIKLKPTIYSFTANRCGVIPGSDILRLKATKILVDMLKSHDIKHSYREVGDRFILSDYLLNTSETEFRPNDVDLNRCLVAPPIEVIVKRFHTGTTKHRYVGMTNYTVRRDHPYFARVGLSNDNDYPKPIVRFDWRNPLRDANGKSVADEILCDDMADWFINTKSARMTALKVYDALEEFLGSRDVVCYDLCLFVSQDGSTVFGEISQDCGRYRHFDFGSLDKDVWRAGGSNEEVLKKWNLMLEVIGGSHV